jgi:hypothetical protein
MRYLKIFAIFYFILIKTFGTAQKPLLEVHASDGEFTEYIYITWKDMGKNTSYRVYRSENEANKNQLELTEKPIKVTFFKDKYRLQMGKRYFYSIKTIKNRQDVAMSKPDAGYLKAIATDNRDTLSRLQNPMDNIEIEMRPLEKDTFSVGENFDVRYIIVNKNATPLSNFAVRFEILSHNIKTAIGNQTIEKLEAGLSQRGIFKIDTKGFTTGTYELLMTINDNKTSKRSFVLIK